MEEKIARIRRVYEASQRVEGELTLAGNGVNSSEAGLTLRWVLKVLDGEETQEYWFEGDDDE